MIKESDKFDSQYLTSAKKALELLEKEIPFPDSPETSIDLVLLDLKMPEMDGLEFLEQVRANPRTRDQGIIIVTAWEDSNKLSKAREGKVAGYLKKPIKEANLLSEIEHYFAGEGKVMIEQTRVETIEREKWVKENMEPSPS